MNNLPLQPLKWARIDTEKLAGIYCQKTHSYIKDAVSFCSTPVAEYVIRQDKETGNVDMNYFADETNSILFFPKYKQLFPFYGKGFI